MPSFTNPAERQALQILKSHMHVYILYLPNENTLPFLYVRLAIQDLRSLAVYRHQSITQELVRIR
jgi:hypothetical protein